MRPPSWSTRLRHLVGSLALVAAASTCLAVGAAAPSFADGDDYPWAGQGQCPLKPVAAPPPAPTDAATGKQGKPGKPGQPGKPAHPVTPANPQANAAANAATSPDTTDTTAPGAPRECAKYIWFINGSYGDPWGFALRNCTSFVAWRLRETNGVTDFTNNMGGGHWGNAENWDDNARSLGYLVDGIPAIGSVAQTDDGRVGHVAWVTAVDGDTVTIEEYNHAGPGIYSTRTVPTTDFRYLHLADVAPAPSLGSTRAPVPAADDAGRSWTFQVDHSGDLVRREAGRKPQSVGPRGAWSPLAAPSTAIDEDGQSWVAVVGRDGRVATAHSTLRGGWTRLQPLARTSGATTSSPALVADDHGVRVLAITGSGDLLQVRETRRGWSRPVRMGAARSWSTHSAVSTAVDAQGRTWLAAVTSHGGLMLRSTTPDGSAWHRFIDVGGSSWSQSSTPALSTGHDGGVWLHAVSARGQLHVFRVRPQATEVSGHRVLLGSWSPYSSPATALDEQHRTWVAAVTTGGQVMVRHRTRQGWTPLRPLGRADALTSPALDPRSNGRVLLSATAAGHTVVRPADDTKRHPGARLSKLRSIPAT